MIAGFRFKMDDAGKFTATMGSPDQGAKEIPTESVIIVKSSK
jgi:hypothetical protein